MCPRFASVSWTLTWDHLRWARVLPFTQVKPIEGRTWGTKHKARFWRETCSNRCAPGFASVIWTLTWDRLRWARVLPLPRLGQKMAEPGAHSSFPARDLLESMCPRFASVFWTLTWDHLRWARVLPLPRLGQKMAEPGAQSFVSGERPARIDVPQVRVRHLDVNLGSPPLGSSLTFTQVRPKDGRTWGTKLVSGERPARIDVPQVRVRLLDANLGSPTWARVLPLPRLGRKRAEPGAHSSFLARDLLEPMCPRFASVF